MKVAQTLFTNIGNYFSNLSISTGYLQAGAVLILVFLLVLSFAQFRRHYVHGSLKGVVVGLFFGFLLTLFLEGFLLIAGRTALTEMLGWKNAPKPVMTALDLGHEKLINVLGVTNEIPSSFANSNPTIENALSTLQSLNPNEIKKVKAIICEP